MAITNGKNVSVGVNASPQKASLNYDGNPFIIFQFNPTELVFDIAADLAKSKGARHTETGAPKVGFSNFLPDKVTIKNIVYDTFEKEKDAKEYISTNILMYNRNNDESIKSKNVLTAYINRYKEAMKFVPGTAQPPVLSFSWGNHSYLKHCFIESLSYRLTMFDFEGVPVRAVIDSLTLVETDKRN